MDDSSTCDIFEQSQLVDLSRKADQILWDETHMVHRNALETFEKTLSDIMTTTSDEGIRAVFGGKTVLLGGDLRQTLPVIPEGTRSMVVNVTSNQSEIWNCCTIFKLKKNMRISNHLGSTVDCFQLKQFADFALGVGDGTIEIVTFEPLRLRHGSKFWNIFLSECKQMILMIW